MAKQRLIQADKACMHLQITYSNQEVLVSFLGHTHHPGGNGTIRHQTTSDVYATGMWVSWRHGMPHRRACSTSAEGAVAAYSRVATALSGGTNIQGLMHRMMGRTTRMTGAGITSVPVSHPLDMSVSSKPVAYQHCQHPPHEPVKPVGRAHVRLCPSLPAGMW